MRSALSAYFSSASHETISAYLFGSHACGTSHKESDIDVGRTGRNMFGPVRGPWPDDSWKGWWGDEPPYHVPVFVLTHHARAPLAMAGGTTFYFVTDGIHVALEQAKAAAGDLDVRLGGGVSTIRQYLRAGLINDLHLALRPVFLGSGEHLLQDIDVRSLGYECAEVVSGERATHMVIRKRA